MLLMLQNHKMVEGNTGGEYVFRPPIHYRNGTSVPEIKLKIWTEDDGRAFVETLTPVNDLTLSTMMPRGLRIPWFGKREIFLVLPWSRWKTDSPTQVTSYCRAFEVLLPGRKVELPIESRFYPYISIAGTSFEVWWEVRVDDRLRVLFLSDTWEQPRTTMAAE
jgi:hypothetical protein